MYTVLWLRFFLTWLRFFRAFFLSCKANARVKLAKTGHGPHSSTLVCICVVRLLFVLFYVLFARKCVLPPGDNTMQLINISYWIYYRWRANWNLSTYYNSKHRTHTVLLKSQYYNLPAAACFRTHWPIIREGTIVDSSWNVMAHGDAREGEVKGKLVNAVGSQYLHTTSEHGISSITTADAHTSAAGSRLNWRPPVDLNGLVRFAEIRNLVSVRVSLHFNWSVQNSCLISSACRCSRLLNT